MKKFIVIVLLLFIIVFFMIINLGRFLDVSQNPKKADLIVCLGGASKDTRIKKAYELFINGYSKSDFILFTGEEWIKSKNIDARELYLNNQGKKVSFSHIKELKNTKDEVAYINKYLIEHDLKSVIIVSDRPHTRRIKTLILFLTREDLTFTLVGSELSYWDTEKYYIDKRAHVYALYEVVKLFNVYITYGFFEKIGLIDFNENYIRPFFSFLEKKLNYITYQYLK